MNAGATEADVEEALAVAAGVMSAEERWKAKQVWERVRMRRHGDRKPGGPEDGAGLRARQRPDQGGA
jgi:hypothetical protein